MAYHSTRALVEDLERTGQLLRIREEVDPDQEAAEIQRRVYEAGGPALLFENVKGSRFAMASNLFGSMERARFIFRDALERVARIVELKVDPTNAMRRPFRYAGVPFTALTMLPRRASSGPVLACEGKLSDLPQVKSWPMDGGPFITLPQVYTEDPERPVPMRSNLGMYRVQLGGNEFAPDEEVGLHYQIHRGIGVHHRAAIERGQPLPVSIFVGGPPAMTLSAVMPLPEGLSELNFAGALARRGVRLARRDGCAVHADADFCITGTIDPQATKPEGPFGDHLGYYSLQHPFPVMRVSHVYHRRDAIWPFTVVGRPPQEDTTFGELIHELTGPVIPTVLPGVKAVHAVDESGVHPLLLALGSERYVPYDEPGRPQELLTQANAILGQGQMSLAKYVWITAGEVDIHDAQAFFCHVLERVDLRRDLHFQTCTTMDTLDYSGSGFNQGSKLVVAAAGGAIRSLPAQLPADLQLPDGLSAPHVCMPGVLAVQSGKWRADDESLPRLLQALPPSHPINGFPLVVVVDDAEFTARTLSNFLWVVFTRSDPARDVHGVASFVRHKHWGCEGSMVIDARIKDHHAPPLEVDPQVSARVDALAAPGGPLHGVL